MSSVAHGYGRVARSLLAPIAIAAAMLPLTSASAQSGYRIAVSPGTDVRFSLREHPGDVVLGRADHVAGDTLVMSTPVRRVLLPNLASLEVRGGRDRHRGIVIGAVALGVVTGVAGGVDYARNNISVGDFIGSWIGNIAIGGALGYLFAPTGWLRLPLPSR